MGNECDDESRYDPMTYFCQSIASKTAELWCIEGGFDAFQPKYSYLCGTMEFADMTAEAKVLVSLCGPSRSASAIIAYLTRELGYSLEHAWDHVHRACRKVDKSLVYWDQLKVWSSNRRLQY